MLMVLTVTLWARRKPAAEMEAGKETDTRNIISMTGS